MFGKHDDRDAIIAELEKQILFLAATFARRDAQLQAQIIHLENNNLQLAQTVSWHQGATMAGAGMAAPGVQ